MHDGSYSVDINRRIRVRDRVRFPLLDDADAVLRGVKEDTSGGRDVRFSLTYDVAHAHRLVPIVKRDWGLQAFRLDGSSDIYVHTRGTFSIVSAAYWWQRLAASVVRLSHRLATMELRLEGTKSALGRLTFVAGALSHVRPRTASSSLGQRCWLWGPLPLCHRQWPWSCS